MEEIGERLVWHYVPFTNTPIPLGGLNILTVTSTLLVMCLLWLGLWLAVRKFSWIPGRAQAIVELVLGSFDSLVNSSMEHANREVKRRILPLIAGLFCYILLCNCVVLIPLPHLEEPTSDLNCTLALGLTSLTYATFCGIRSKGALAYLKEFRGPMWRQEGGSGAVIVGKLSALFFLPLKVVEELSRLISISFRLFGNIIGAATIITVVSTLTYYVCLPLALDAFLLMFEAAVQAFVFALLTLMYASASMQEE